MSKHKSKEDTLDIASELAGSPDADTLNIDTILSTEFNYIAQTAFQANEDRARVTSFYLVTVGTFLAAILSTQFITAPNVLILGGFSLLFLIISIMGLLTLFQLARLRSAWYESILALNQIKDFYINHIPNYPLSQAFRWATHSTPPKAKLNSISFLLVLEVTLLGALSFGIGTIFLTSALGNLTVWSGLIAGPLFLVFQLFVYFRYLKNA